MSHDRSKNEVDVILTRAYKTTRTRTSGNTIANKETKGNT